jgi:hypothetical protein
MASIGDGERTPARFPQWCCRGTREIERNCGTEREWLSTRVPCMSSRKLYRDRRGRCCQFIAGDDRDTMAVSISFGHKSYRENLQRLGEDRNICVEVNGDEMVAEGGASRWLRW